MTDKKSSLRLDTILVNEGIVTDEQIKEALKSQKEVGGKFGSHLMRLGFVQEPDLVRALSKQCGCDGVVLTDLEIPQIVIKLIPTRIAIARKVLPFDYEPDTNTLKIACEDPTDSRLVDELSFVARGKGVKLFVAGELSLRAAIDRYYPSDPEGESEASEIVLDESADNLQTDQSEQKPELEELPLVEDSSGIGAVLLVTNEADDGRAVESILTSHRYRVVTTESADDAIDIIGDQHFDSVFIKDTVPGDYIDLIDRLRKTSPRTSVRYYESAAGLLLHNEASDSQNDLLVKNLDLFTSLLVSREKLEDNHSSTVGQYVDRLCRRIGLPEKDRMMITTAAYLHDAARYYYPGTDLPKDPRALVELTVKLLESLSFSPLIVGMLRKMYIDLGGKYTKRLPIEALGGNIITAVDIFCDSMPVDKKMSLDAFELMKAKFYDLTGKLFLSEVAEAIVGMIHDEMLAEAPDSKYGQVLILVRDRARLSTVEKRLKAEGFKTIADDTVNGAIDLYKRGRPDMMILLGYSLSEDAVGVIDELSAGGIELDHVPTFLLTDFSGTSQLSSILNRGVEDIIPTDDNLNLLVAKMKRIQARIEERSQHHQTITEGTGSQGNLEDMNLIDLLQALGPSRKTIKMTISSPEGHMELFLDKGNITYAKLQDLAGADAVYESMTWSHGMWQMQPVEEEQLPEPNNEFSNESIMMEGCRLLDEKNRPADETQKIGQMS